MLNHVRPRAVVSALIMSAAAIAPLSASPASPAMAGPGWETRATASPSAVTAGSSTTVTVRVMPPSTTRALVDVEIHGPAGRVFQQIYDNRPFTAGTTRTFVANWNVPGNTPVGGYVIKVWVFGPGWSSFQHWNDSAGSLAVQSATGPPTTTITTTTTTTTPTTTTPPATTTTPPTTTTTTPPTTTTTIPPTTTTSTTTTTTTTPPTTTTAPSSATVPTFGGCQVLPADNPFNTRVDPLPVRAGSAAAIAATNSSGSSSRMLFQMWSEPSSGFHPIAVAANQPFVPITYDQYPWSSDPGPFPIPLDAPLEASNGDNHVIVVQQGTCQLYELWAAHRSPNGWYAGTGAQWNLGANETSPTGWVSADAAGLPILPGLLRYEEVASGTINHALRMTVSLARKAYILPATSLQASGTTAHLPNGARLRLRADYDISGFTGQSLVIARAMKTYGLIVADQGPSWMISGVGDSRWNDNDMNQIRNIPATALEWVDNGVIHTS